MLNVKRHLGKGVTAPASCCECCFGPEISRRLKYYVTGEEARHFHDATHQREFVVATVSFR